MKRVRRLIPAAALALFLIAFLAPPALATVSISRAELEGSRLRVEGRGATPNTKVSVNGGQASATSDSSGNYRIENSSFPKPSDCRVVVSDGTSSATATLSGCTPTAPASLSSLTVSPTTVTGGNSATGTVTLTSAAPTGGASVTLSSSYTSAATVSPSVTVPAGSTSRTFNVTTMSVPASSSSTISAAFGGVTRTAAVTVNPATTTSPGPSLSSLTVSPSEVVGPDPATGTVTLTSSAPSGGFVVDLSSDNTAAATVPPNVTVPAGSTRATFTVSTKQVTNAQSAAIIGTVGGDWNTHKYGLITVWDAFHFSNGSVSLARGGKGQGRIISQPAGIDCTFTSTGTTGKCNNAFFPEGTRVKLEARAAANSRFLGWEFEVSCRNAPEVTVQAGVAHICRPVFALR
jgi:hypothetical protein